MALQRQARTRLDGDDLRAMFSAATALFESNVGAINALNVFPVPDGDTGTNMFLTLKAVAEGAADVPGGSAADVAKAMASGALMGARGNSGVILSQFFKGLSIGLADHADFGTAEMARAFKEAREHAYRAVGNPVEGTLLTVISSVSEAAQQARSSTGDFGEFYQTVCDAARESVAETPTMLSVLREAGVVDAGGQGLSVILEGNRRWVAGEQEAPVEIAPPDAIGVHGATGLVTADFLDAAEEDLYGYCTQFMIEGEAIEPDAIRGIMDDLALSTVVVGDEKMVKVHVHAEDPGPVVSAAVAHGMLSQVNIQNMDEQHSDFSVARRQEVTTVPLAVVAVAWGKGLEEVFTNLGASGIVTGGNTMNPSVQDLLGAIEAAPSERVILLPNNGNIVPAATQAAEMSKKTARVVATRSIPQGVAAVLALDVEQDLDSNVAEMEEALSSVKTAEVTEAVRSATLNDVAVNPGDIIGLLEHQLVVAGDDISDVLSALLGKADFSDETLVTLYWGDPLEQNDAQAAADRLTEDFPDAEIELVQGGQPHYHFILSIE